MGEVVEFMQEFETDSLRWMPPTTNSIPPLEEFMDISRVMLPGVYILYLQEEIVYIGQSKCMAGRIADHAKGYDKKRSGRIIFDKVRIWVCIHDGKRKAVESALITKYNPPYNFGGVANPWFEKQKEPEYTGPKIKLTLEGLGLGLSPRLESKPVLLGIKRRM